MKKKVKMAAKGYVTLQQKTVTMVELTLTEPKSKKLLVKGTTGKKYEKW